MVKIRLMRVGKRKQPSYRVVVADSRSPRDGRIIEAIGHYHPRQEPSEVVIDTARADYWLGVGAQPSQSVVRLLEIARGTAPAAPAPAPKKVTAAASVEAAAEEAPEQPAEAPSADATPAEATPPEATEQAAAAPEATPAEDVAEEEPSA